MMFPIRDEHLPYGLRWKAILTGSALFTAGLIVRGLFVSPKVAGVIPSPRKTLLPKLSKEELSKIPYPLDALPGARDVETPFGSIRVYEFGPEDGRKVLFVHGISTPCLALSGVAHGLADKGCRVMLFDLPGRGYSDTPSDLHQDKRLFISLIFLVLASSRLSWTGSASEGFSLIGYSLGGGISAAFMAYFPQLVTSLILIAPAGLLRDYHISRSSRLLYSEGVIPEPILTRMVKSRLTRPMYPAKEQPKAPEDGGVETAVQAEANTDGKKKAILSRAYPNLTVEDAVAHQVINHEGFVSAFMSSIRYGPIQHQHSDWNRIGKWFNDKSNISENMNDRVLIILGKDDPIIKLDEIKKDATEALDGNVEFQVINAGHEAPVTKADETVGYIWAFWNA